ncbi:hypothetical protein L9F63_001953, partial [Diploptera punctata]
SLLVHMFYFNLVHFLINGCFTVVTILYQQMLGIYFSDFLRRTWIMLGLFFYPVSGELAGFNVGDFITLFGDFNILDFVLLVYDESNEVVHFYTYNPYELPSVLLFTAIILHYMSEKIKYLPPWWLNLLSLLLGLESVTYFYNTLIKFEFYYIFNGTY